MKLKNNDMLKILTELVTKLERRNQLGVFSAFCPEVFLIMLDLVKYINSDFDVESKLAGIHKILQLATDQKLTPKDVEDFQYIYNCMYEKLLPNHSAYIKHCQAQIGYSANFNSMLIGSAKLLSLEKKSYEDPSLSDALEKFRKRLQKIKDPVEDVIGNSQIFELYAEAFVYDFLKSRFDIVEKIDENSGKNGSSPDFKCCWGDKVFFIELKTLDIVDGEFHHQKIKEQGIEKAIELEEKIFSTKKVTSNSVVVCTESEIAPNYKSSQKNYDVGSYSQVICMLEEKITNAFKPSQFEKGPTFAFVVLDRLSVHGNLRNSLSPCYYDPYDNSIISGELWNLCFGREGWPIYRPHHFEGESTLKEYLPIDGLYTNIHKDFLALGLIAMNISESIDKSYGLYSKKINLPEGWSQDDLWGVMHKICDYFNDNENSQGYNCSLYTDFVNETKLEVHLKSLSDIKQYIEKEKLPENYKMDSDFYSQLFKKKVSYKDDLAWLNAHGKAICNQIDKLLKNKERVINNNLFNSVKEMLYDLGMFHRQTGYIDNQNNYYLANNSIVSQDVYRFTERTLVNGTHTINLSSRSMGHVIIPFTIRQAIELKLKEMIFFEQIQSGAENPKIKMFDIFKIFMDGKYHTLPIDINIIKLIYEWANTYIHEGIMGRCWQSFEAVDFLSPLFEREIDGGINLEGYKFFKKSIMLTDEEKILKFKELLKIK